MYHDALTIKFDRTDWTYVFDEEVSGTVVLDSDAGYTVLGLHRGKIATCNGIWLEYGWRTHGKGNPDKGEKTRIDLLSEETHFRNGERREFPFHFTAPNGPVTYHGQIINVDWYVTAYVEVPPFFPKIRIEHDFLLVAGDSPGEINLGTKSIYTEHLATNLEPAQANKQIFPKIESITRPNVSGLNLFGYIVVGILVVVLGLILFVTLNPGSQYYHSWWGAILIFLGAIVTMGILAQATINIISRLLFEICDFQLIPKEVYAGGELTCRLQLRAKRKLFLEEISAQITAEEIAVSGAGTQQQSHSFTAFTKSVVKSYDENLLEGRCIYFEGILPIPLHGPPTFVATSNSINWSVKVRMVLKRGPNWIKTIPITVLPCSFSQRKNGQSRPSGLGGGYLIG